MNWLISYPTGSNEIQPNLDGIGVGEIAVHSGEK